jgi:hypothetical protein
MPTWPTTTVPTGNLDAGSDQPSAARADIKTMADVVNALVAYGTPSGGSTVTIFSLSLSSSGTLISGTTYRANIAETYDPGNVLSITSNQFSLGAGTYLLICSGSSGGLFSQVSNFGIYNVTDSSANVQDYPLMDALPGSLRNGDGSFSSAQIGKQSSFTLSSTKTLEFRYSNSSASAGPSLWITFIKIG